MQLSELPKPTERPNDCLLPRTSRSPIQRVDCQNVSGTSLHAFIVANYDKLTTQCRERAERRCGCQKGPTVKEMTAGGRQFLNQLTRTLRAERNGEQLESLRISGLLGGNLGVKSEVGLAASTRGRHLFALGCSAQAVAEVYVDLGVSITDLAVERDAQFRSASSPHSTGASRTPSRTPTANLTGHRVPHSWQCGETLRILATCNKIRRVTPEGAGCAGARSGFSAYWYGLWLMSAACCLKLVAEIHQPFDFGRLVENRVCA